METQLVVPRFNNCRQNCAGVYLWLTVGLTLLFAGRLLAANTDYAREVTQARLFMQPLVYVGTKPPPAVESEELLGDVGIFKSDGVAAGFKALEHFLTEHPRSSWAPAVEVNMAEYYRRTGQYIPALSHWQAAWNGAKDSKNVAGQEIAVRAFAGWTRLLASLGRTKELTSLYQELDARHLRLGSYATKIQETRDALGTMDGRPGLSYRCGSYALGHLAMQLHSKQQVISNLFTIDSPNGGFTMAELLSLAETNGLAVEAVRRPIGAALVVPCVVHWKLNHYAAIVEEKDGHYLVDDPTFEHQVWMDAATIDAESSGDFILPANKVPDSWKKLTTLACAKIYGKGYPNNVNDNNDTPQCQCPPCSDSSDSDNDPPSSNDGAGGGGDNPPNSPSPGCSGRGSKGNQGLGSTGMPRWRVSEPYINLWLTDTPLRYGLSDGSWESLTLTYKSRGEAHGQNTGGFGDDWSCNWLAMIQQQAGSSGWVDWIPGGGSLPMNNIGQKIYKTGQSFHTNCVTMQLSVNGGGVFRSVTTCTVMQAPTLSQFIYNSVATDVAGDTDTLLNYAVDRYGRALQEYNYATNSGVVQMVNMVDKDGRTNTLFYGDSSHPWLITAVTNAYGQSVHFKYDFTLSSDGLLTNIVDAQGMSSYFQYDSNEQITNMITAYGTNSFQYFDGVDTNDQNALVRSLLITEPSGDHQLYAYRDDAPVSLLTHDGFPSYRLSFHWNRRQYQYISDAGKTNVLDMSASDYYLASYKHWLHGDPTLGSSSVSDTLDSQGESYDPINQTNPGVIFYNWEGEESPYISQGNTDAMQRVTGIFPFDYGYTAGVDITRNSLGRPTNYTYCVGAGGGEYPEASYTNFFDSTGTILQYEVGPSGELTRGYGYDPVMTNLLTSVTNAVGDVLRYTHQTNTLKVTSITFPSGLVRTNIYYSSGPEQGFLEMQADLGVRTNWFGWQDGNLVAQTNELGLVTTYTYDNLNRLTSVAYPDGTTTSNVYDKLDIVAAKDRLNQWTYYDYNNLRQLVAVTNVDGQVTTYDYCSCGSPDEIIHWEGTTPFVTQLNYDMVGRVTNIVYPDGYQLNYTYDLLDRPQTITDGDGNQLSLTWYGYGLNSMLQSATSEYQTLLSRTFDQYGRIISSTDRNNVTITNGYDFLNRLVARQDQYGVAGLETFVYNARGLEQYINQLGHTNTYVRDVAGRITAETNANNEVLQFAYNPTDELQTLTDGKGQATSWGYDQYGRVTNKVDNAGVTDFVYQYDADNRLTNRWTPAKGTTVYRYDPLGNLTNVDYSGGTNYTPSIHFAYDGLNRLTNMLDGLGDTAFTWTPGDQLASENGPWDDDAVNYTYDPGSRLRSQMSIAEPNASPWVQTYGYDSMMRLTNVTSGAGSFGYLYDSYYTPASDQVGSVYLPSSQGPSASYIANSFDSLGRQTEASLSTYHAYDSLQYTYDEASEVTQQVFNAYIRNVTTGYFTDFKNYTYDNIGQLTGAQGFDGDPNYPPNPPRLQEQFGYGYDKAWNLSARTNNALVESFGVNNVNELSSAGYSGKLTVSGTATEPDGNAPIYASPGVTSVTVNTSNAIIYEDGTFAATNFTPANGWNTYTAIAEDDLYPPRSSTNEVSVYLPTSISYTYDANGNLLSDGSRNFEYDDENQLTAVWEANSWSNNFAYDGLLRKRVEKDYNWTGSAWQETNEIRFIYDGYLAVQERDGNNLPQVTYTRGNDLSGSLQGAGGIGGLVARTDMGKWLGGDSHASDYYFSDAQGNVAEMVDTNGLMVAQYKYDPFGNVISMSGPLANANRYRFSSKEWNDAAGLYYYGFRFYDPNLQRWPNRDPLGDWGGLAYLGPLLNQDGNTDTGGSMSPDEFVGLLAQINVNPFGAMNNDPINYSDPNGNCAGAIAGSLAGVGTGESLAGAAVSGGVGAAFPWAVAALGYEAQAFYNGLPPQTTFYNPQGNYVNAPPSMAHSTLPAQGGPPNGSLAEDNGNGGGKIRDYGPDGRAKTDYDFGHDHGAGDPHAHDWDWSNPNPRGPGRPLCPGE